MVYSIIFLDVKRVRQLDRFDTTYTKSTECNNLLYYNIFHISLIFKSLPGSQFTKVRRISSTTKFFFSKI